MFHLINSKALCDEDYNIHSGTLEDCQFFWELDEVDEVDTSGYQIVEEK